jgi:prefoldin subunit 5
MAFLFGVLIFVSLLFGSCATTGVDPAILNYQQQVTELEDRNNDLSKRLELYSSTVEASEQRLAALTARAGRMGTEVDDIIGLFNAYQREVERLLSDYKQIQEQTSDG